MVYDTTNTLLSSIVESNHKRTIGNGTSDEIHQVTSFNDTENIYKTQCFPLYSILLAIGKTEIDYFGLDVEGSEYKILNTVPWGKVDIKVIHLCITFIFFVCIFHG